MCFWDQPLTSFISSEDVQQKLAALNTRTLGFGSLLTNVEQRISKLEASAEKGGSNSQVQSLAFQLASLETTVRTIQSSVESSVSSLTKRMADLEGMAMNCFLLPPHALIFFFFVVACTSEGEFALHCPSCTILAPFMGQR